MLDDDARRALEEEAIALVSLSHGAPMAKKRPAPATAAGAVGAKRPHQSAPTLVGIHPLLQQNKATLMARRDDSSVQHAHRVNTATAPVGRPGGVVLKPLQQQRDRQEERCLSMSVFVNADGNMSVLSKGKGSPDHHGAFELTAMDPVSAKEAGGPMNAVTVTHEEMAAPTATIAGAEPQISMQSLLVTLKKHQTQDGSEQTSSAAATKLPRFRDVFEPARQEQQVVASQTVAPTPYPAAPVPSMPSSPPADESLEESPYPPPPELKCKYRTGKCGNMRALKSCGDYHNLCNYHRLRANANQRKLDRKKKVQRQQPTPNGTSSAATSPVAAPRLMAAPAATAAAALASMPASFMLPRAAGSHHASPFLPYLVPPTAPLPVGPTSESPSLLRPKPETKSC